MAKKKVAKSKKKKPQSELSFEESLGELEQIVADLEGGELGLAEALDRYEQGVGHLKACQAQLVQAERKIELLSGVDANGNPITEPYDDEAADSLEEKASARGRRRSRSGSRHSRSSSLSDAEVDEPGRLF